MLWLSSSNHFPRRFASFEATRGPTTPGAFWYPLQNEAGHSRGSTGIGVWPSGQICRPDDLGNAMFLNYSLTRMLALSARWALGAFALVVAVTTACFWRPLFSREARGRRRQDRNYRKISSKRRHGPAIQLNLEVPREERDRKR